MKTRPFTFCPRCATRLRWHREHRQDPPRQACPNCHFTFYHNPVAATEALIIRNKKLLMVRRGQQPRKGYLDVPGGFIDGFEDPAKGVIREVNEELGVRFTPRKLIGAYIDHYLWQGIDRPVVILSFYGTIRGAAVLNDEVTRIQWVPLAHIPTVLAFSHMQKSISDLRRSLNASRVST